MFQYNGKFTHLKVNRVQIEFPLLVMKWNDMIKITYNIENFTLFRQLNYNSALFSDIYIYI